MAADGQVVFEIQGDNRPLRQTLQETTADIQHETRNWDNAVSGASDNMAGSFVGALKAMGAAAAAAKIGQVLLDFGKAAIDAASDLEEVQNVVDVTFGESANEINAWAKNAINQFGLTETQAKRFASTMGAMMKSSGIASKDITAMSEDLAGLAADMASFYNLDFDEAFNKIRSGISGETEPLKQLGINMSVANLEAFALAQGIEKAFDKMDQSEQIMLRYQYLMQATADAQGDFSRTSDGFANGLRLLSSNFEQLKTTVGTLLLPVITEAITGLNSMLALLIPDQKKKTVLDDFAEIDLKTEQKVSDIEKTKNEADALVKILEDLESTTISTDDIDLSGIAEGANKLSANAGTNWDNFITGLDGVDDVITNSEGGETAGKDLKGLANGAGELTGTPVSTFKYDKLPEKIKALYNQAAGVTTAKDNFDTLDEEGKDLTTGTAGDFKYSKLAGDIGNLVGAADMVVDKNIAGDFGTLTQAADSITGTDAKDFKYKGLTGDIEGFVTAAESTDGAKEGLKKINDAADEVTGSGAEEFKYNTLKEDIEGFVETAGTTEDTKADLAKINDAADEVTGTGTANFKYNTLTGEIEEFVGAADSVTTNNVESDLTTLDNSAKKVSGTDDGFKYESVADGVDDLIKNSAGGAEAGTQLEGLNKASGLAGNKESFRYAEFATKVKALIDNATGGTTAGTELEDVGKGAAKVAGTEAGFKYGDAADSVDDLIKNANGGTQAGTDLTNVASGAQAVANVTYNSSADPIGTIAGKIKILDSTSKRNWEKVLDVFRRIPGYTKDINPETIKSIAGAFGDLQGDKATAWETLMNALGSDLSALSTLTGKDENSAAAWLEQMKEAANGLDSNDVNAWDTLFSLLVNGTPGAGNFLNPEDLADLAKTAGMPTATIEKLGDATSSAASKQKQWLETCKRLVQLIPGLNKIINTETGEIKGGTQAVKDYIAEWEAGQKKLIAMQALEEKEKAFAKKKVQLVEYDIDARVAKKKYEEFLKGVSEETIKQWDLMDKQGLMVMPWDTERKEYVALRDEAAKTERELEKQQKAYDDAEKEIQQYRDAVYDMAGEVDNANGKQQEGAGAAKQYNDAQKKAAQEGVAELADALKELNDYIESTEKSTKSNVDSALSGMKQFETASSYLDRLQKESTNKVGELQKQLAEAKKNGTGTWEIELKLKGEESAVPSLQNMRKTFEENLKFIQEYQKDLELAKKNGASDELLAQFADFSQENAAYLHLLAHGTPKEVKQVTDAYQSMSDAKKPLIKALTETKLKADETFNDLVEKAKEAAIKLNNSEVAQDSMAATVEGIAKGIADKVPEVKEAVDALNAELARLGEMKDYNVFGGLQSGGAFSFHFTPDGSFAVGTDYVPFDNFLAYLHEGEAVLTAEEAAVWRNFKAGGANQANSIDYGQLSGAIWDNAPSMGGNVYLDGHTVGRVISAQQANSYRALERSGWQG